MPSLYHDMEFSRAFRPVAVAELRALPAWEGYRVAQGWPSNAPNDRAQLCQAAEALGLDLHAAKRHFDACSAAALASPRPLTASFQPAVPAFTATATSEDVTEMPNDTENKTTETASAEAPSAEGFEGRDAESVLAELLSPASVHMTPYLQATLPTLLRPLADIAVKPARVVTVTRRAPGPMPLVPHATVTKWTKPHQAFGLSPSKCGNARAVLVDGSTLPHCDYQDAPRVDPDYVWTPRILAAMAACDARGMNMWAFGPAGTGKTESAAQYAARLGRPFVRIAIDRSTEAADIIGQWVLAKDGGMRWQDGKLTQAFRMPYCVVLIDEPTLLRPGALAIFQTALDTRRIYLPGGEIVEAETGLFVIAADNTSGCGDDSGRYVDTAPMNAAFLDRFALRVEYEHLSPTVEAEMIKRRTGIALDAARLMSDFAGLTRRDVQAGKLTMGLTPRRLLAWASVVCAGIPSADAFAMAVTQGTAPEDREALAMLAVTSLRHPDIDALARGQKAPSAAPSADDNDDTAPSRAGTTFPDDQR